MVDTQKHIKQFETQNVADTFAYTQTFLVAVYPFTVVEVAKFVGCKRQTKRKRLF